MNEQVSLNGAPVVGFGATSHPGAGEAFLWYSPLIGLVGGAVGGGYLGSKSRYGTTIGAVAGGVAGTVVTPLLTILVLSAFDDRARMAD